MNARARPQSGEARTLGRSTPTPDLPFLRVSLLSGFELAADRVAVAVPPAAERVVAFLALGGRLQLRVHVAGTLWPETSEERACANLRSSLWRIRRLGLPVVRATATHLALDDRVAVDVHEVVALLVRILHDASWTPDPDILPMLTPAELLPGWYEEWVVTERERLRQLRLHALEATAERLTAEGRFGPAVEAGLAAVGDDPLRESAHRVLIKAYMREGNVGDAVSQFERYRAILERELGLEPSTEMAALLRR